MWNHIDNAETSDAQPRWRPSWWLKALEEYAEIKWDISQTKIRVNTGCFSCHLVLLHYEYSVYNLNSKTDDDHLL